MKNKVKTIIKTTILLIFILLLTVFIYSKITKQNVFALTPQEATRQSQSFPIEDEAWNSHRAQSGDVVVVDSYEYDDDGRPIPARSLYDYPGIRRETVAGVEYIILTPTELHEIKSLFCSGRNVNLSTGYFTLQETRYCTPQEAWVLAEYENNYYTPYEVFTPTTTDVTREVNTAQRMGELKSTGKIVMVDEKPYYVYEYDGVGDEKYAYEYVDDYGDTYYYAVTVEESSGGYSYVQYAWWNVKHPGVGTDSTAGTENDFAREAKDFQNYVLKVNGLTDADVDKLIDPAYGYLTDDGYFIINYDISSTPVDKGLMDVTFNAETNKYLIGPFTVDYKRYVTKQGDREKVEFCGISSTILTGTDFEGNELLGEDGNSVFKLGENYKFIFESEEKHKSYFSDVDYYADYDTGTRTGTTISDYAKNYPGPNETFYIEVNYLDDLAKIKSFKMQFFYKTACGQYEYWEGTTRPPEDEYDPPPSKQQPQAKAIGEHKVINVDADKGTAIYGIGDRARQAPEIEFFTFGELDLTTRLAGKVWIDHDEAKDSSTGTLGIYDGIDTPAPKNSVEIKVWKVTYNKSGRELREEERELAIAFKDDRILDFADRRLFIDENGEYKIDHIQVPSYEGLDTSKYLVSYDVEFIYDGQTYEATEFFKSAGKDTVEEKLAAFKKTSTETAGAAKDYTTYAKDSYIVENADERKAFDKYFTEIFGKEPVDKSSGKTSGAATGGPNGGIYLDDILDGTTSPEVDGETSLEYDSDFVVRENNGDVNTAERLDETTGTDTYTKLTSELITHDEEGFTKEQYRFASRTSESGLLLPYETKYHPEVDNYDNIKVFGSVFKPIDEYFNQINLGLLQRYETDISVQKDLYTGKVVVNKQETTYTFNSLAPLTEDALKQQLDLSYREQKYKIGLYNADYYYRSSVYDSVEDELTKSILQTYKEDTELRLFVTYKIRLYNGSEYTDVSLNKFKDYYDKTFTLVNDEPVVADILDNEGNSHEKIIAEKPYYRKLKPSDEDTPAADKTELYRFNKEEDLVASQIVKDSSGKPITGELSFDYMKDSDNPLTTENGEFKCATSDDLKALNESEDGFDERLSLTPGQSMEVFVTYEVDREGFARAKLEYYSTSGERENLLGKKCNIAELTRFSTAYTDESVARHKTTRYSAGQISGRVDRNSAPDNVNMSDTNRDNVDIRYFEDDTETAPTLTVDLKTGDPRTIDGVVWEDSRGTGGGGSELPYGDGFYTDGEAVIPDADVTLVEKIKINAGDIPGATLDDLEHEFEYVWPDDAFGDLDFESRVKTGPDGKYEFKNFASGLYVVRFEYGNSEDTLKYNGQDYKNTSYQTGMTNAEPASDGSTVTGIDEYNVPRNATLNNEWHDLSSNENARTLEATRVSDARDYEPRRIKVNTYSRTITNKNAEVLAAYVDDNDKNLTNEYAEILEANKDQLISNTAMVANTAKFNVEIEKQDSIAYKTIERTQGDQQNNRVSGLEGDGTSHEYKITNVDFGLVRRPETRINIRKEINSLKLSKNDGSEPVLQVYFKENGDIEEASSKLSANIDKITEIRKENLNDDSQGFKYVAIEASFLKGLTVQITYRITVENNSEVDYVGTQLAYYKNMQDLYNLVARYEKEGNFDIGEHIVYGKYLGLNYYTNNCYTGEIESGSASSKYGTNYDDVIVKTTIDQLIDYVDNDLSIDKSVSEAGILDNYWLDSSTDDRTNKLSEIAYLKNDETLTFIKDDTVLVDNKNRNYYSTDVSTGATRNNLVLSANSNMEKNDTLTFQKTQIDENKAPKFDHVEGSRIIPQLEDVTLTNVYTSKLGMSSATRSSENEKLTTELEPGQKTETFVSTSAQANEEGINHMNYDNLVEIVMYSNPVGRRDTETIPGNANMIAKQLSFDRASYNYNYDTNRYEPKHVEVGDGSGVKTIDTERDTFAPRDTVTFSEPTGLSLRAENINRIVRIILITLVIAVIAVMATAVTVVIKNRKCDNGKILKAKETK